jgi:hydroxymethylpyrimidine/phosphomethylpyrimidine kinase
VVGGGRRRRVALTIAGSDSSAGAGVAADLKVFQAYGVWGTLALTAVTAQNTVGVQDVFPLPPGIVRAQIESVASDMGVDALKTGMLADAAVVRAVSAAVADLGLTKLVVDPVLVASHGRPLLEPAALGALRDELIPRAAVLAPNLIEAEALLGRPVRDREAMAGAAADLAALAGPGGGLAVYLKGGHLDDSMSAVDLLLAPGSPPRWLESPRLEQPHTHGTGCVLSAAITAGLALGLDVAESSTAAKRFVTAAIAAGGGVGKGVGPIDPGAGSGPG